ncbi:MAG: hypothetical protein AAGJ79_03125 [Verrucomicrobiota bacterium]
MKPAPFCLYLFLSILAPAPPLFSDDHDEEEEEENERILVRQEIPGQEETIKFYHAHIPSAMPILERVRDREGEEAYEEVLRDAAEQIAEYRHIQQHDGDEMAELFIEGVRLDMEINALAYKYHEIDDSDRERRETREQLRDVIGMQFAHAIQSRVRELDWLRSEMESIEREIDEMGEDREESIEEELEMVLYGNEEEEWDEDDEEEDDDEDDEDDEEED